MYFSGNILHRLWGHQMIPDDKVGDTRYTRTVMENIWHLLQNNEFVYSALFEQYDVFPEVYGNCGHYYLVEKVKIIFA